MPNLLRIEVERSGRWRAAPIPSRKKRTRPKGEPAAFERPVHLTLASGEWLAATTAFGLPDGSMDSIVCLDVLEYVRNDSGLVDEIARVLRPGGTVMIRVPTTGLFAGLDAFNLFRYVVDITKRGARPYETSELGWRRHYSEADLRAMLGPDRFTVTSVRRRKLAIAEMLTFAAMVLFRWLMPSRNRFRAVQRLARPIDLVEYRIVTPFGSVIEVEAIRLSEPPV